MVKGLSGLLYANRYYQFKILNNTSHCYCIREHRLWAQILF